MTRSTAVWKTPPGCDFSLNILKIKEEYEQIGKDQPNSGNQASLAAPFLPKLSNSEPNKEN